MAEKKSPRFTNKKHVARLERENQQRKILITISVIVVAAVLLTIGIGLLYDKVLKYNQPVAEVNGEKIKLGEYQDTVRYNRYQAVQQYLQYYAFYEAYPDFGASLQPQLQQIQTQLEEDYAGIIGSSVLDRMVDDVIVRQQAELRGITVSQEEIDARMEQYFGYNQENIATPTPFPTIAPTSTLSAEQLAIITVTPTATATEPPAEPTATPEPTTVPEEQSSEPTVTPFPTATPFTQEGYNQLKDEFFTQLSDAGVSKAFFTEFIRSILLREKLVDEITRDYAVVQEQVWARHILVADEAAAQVIRQRLDNGEDFGEVAKEVSTDSSNSANGGDLGYFPRGMMDPSFEEAAFALQIGEISQPVKSQFGWHIIQVLGKEDRALDQSTYQSARQGVFQKWFNEVKSGQEIETFDSYLDQTPVEPNIPLDKRMPSSL